jgi:tetratricopeptide (TPR) repeat protein
MSEQKNASPMTTSSLGLWRGARPPALRDATRRGATARRRKAVAAACLGLLLAASAHATPLEDMRRQVEGSQFDQAWQTAQRNPQLIGDVHFDFLYGVAAINVGRVAEGVLALERHLSAVPANDRARLELARGYFLLGEYPRARSEFEFLLRYNPPAGVRANIATFLQAMQVRDASDRRAAARFYAEVGAGYDNNVNLGTFRDQLQLVFGTISLDGSPSRQVADGFGQVAVGAQQVLRVSNRFSVFVGGDLEHRGNVKEQAYDTTNAGAYIGFSQIAGAWLWRATLGTSELRVSGDRYRDTLQATAEANMNFTQDLALTAFAQYGELRYSAAEEVRDARSTTVGVSVTRNFPALPLEPSVGLRISYTQEDNQRLRRDLSKKLPIVRLYASASPAPRTRISVGLSAYQEKYGGTDIGFGNVRRDDAFAADAAVNYALDAKWSLRADAAWAITRSNQDLYDKSRKAVSVKLRYQY